MDKGQHIRIFIIESSTSQVIAMSTDLSLHGSATTENSTTKDTSDGSGGPVWDEFEVTARNYDISIGALVAAGTDTAAKTLNDIINGISDNTVNWEICMASGANNRVKGKCICKGSGKLTGTQISAQVGQNATYTGTIQGYGPLVVGND